MRAGAGARVMSASSSGGRPPAYDPAAAAAEAWQAPLRDICAAAAAAGCGPPTLARLAASRLLLTAPVACLRVRAREQAASYSACGACRLACRSGAGA
jgi:hypothetical protein